MVGFSKNGSNIELENFCFNIQKYSDDNLLSKENLLNHCASLLKEITEKTCLPIGFALDEASAAENDTNGMFYSWMGTKRAVLTVLLESLLSLDFNYLVFAGTNYSFAESSQLASTTFKESSLKTNIITDFELIPSIQQYLSIHLNVSDCQNVFNDYYLMKKSNFTRGRFGGRLIGFISNYSENYPNLTKEEVLRKSINDTYNGLVDDVFKTLSKFRYNNEMIQNLIKIYNLTKYSKKDQINVYDEAIMKIGITKMTFKDGEFYFQAIREFAIIEAVDKFLQTYACLKLINSHVSEFNMNSSGFAIESIYFSTLCSEKYVGKTIKELPLFHDSPDLPEWTKDFVWNVEMKSIVNFDDLIYFKNIGEMYGKIVKLSNNFHGDIFVLWKIESKFYYFNLSSKFYKSTVPLEDHLKNQNSTDISKAYFDNYWTDKMSSNKCSVQREIILDVLNNFGGCIRVHVEIPNNRVREKFIIKENCISININSENLNDLVDNQKIVSFLLSKVV
jgi:hypothetical protein